MEGSHKPHLFPSKLSDSKQQTPKLMYIQIPQERVGVGGSAAMKIAPCILPTGGSDSGGDGAGVPCTDSPLANCTQANSVTNVCSSSQQPSPSISFGVAVSKSNTSLGGSAPISLGPIIRVTAPVLTDPSSEDVSVLSSPSTVNKGLLTNNATHWITIPGSRGRTGIAFAGRTIPSKISNNSGLSIIKNDVPKANRRILPAPSPSPVIRVTASNRSTPTTLTIHPGTKSGVKAMMSPLASTLHKAAVIVTSADAAASGFMLAGHSKMTSVTASSSSVGVSAALGCSSEGAVHSNTRGIVVGTSPKPLTVSSIRLCPASVKSDSSAIIVDLTDSKDGDESDTSERLRSIGVGGRIAAVSSNSLPSTPVILHTPKLSNHSMTALQGGGLPSSTVTTRPVITVPRVRFTTHTSLASLTKKSSGTSITSCRNAIRLPAAVPAQPIVAVSAVPSLPVSVPAKLSGSASVALQLLPSTPHSMESLPRSVSQQHMPTIVVHTSSTLLPTSTTTLHAPTTLLHAPTTTILQTSTTFTADTAHSCPATAASVAAPVVTAATATSSLPSQTHVENIDGVSVTAVSGGAGTSDPCTWSGRSSSVTTSVYSSSDPVVCTSVVDTDASPPMPTCSPATLTCVSTSASMESRASSKDVTASEVPTSPRASPASSNGAHSDAGRTQSATGTEVSLDKENNAVESTSCSSVLCEDLAEEESLKLREGLHTCLTSDTRAGEGGSIESDEVYSGQHENVTAIEILKRRCSPDTNISSSFVDHQEISHALSNDNLSKELFNSDLKKVNTENVYVVEVSKESNFETKHLYGGHCVQSGCFESTWKSKLIEGQKATQSNKDAKEAKTINLTKEVTLSDCVPGNDKTVIENEDDDDAEVSIILCTREECSNGQSSGGSGKLQSGSSGVLGSDGREPKREKKAAAAEEDDDCLQCTEDFHDMVSNADEDSPNKLKDVKFTDVLSLERKTRVAELKGTKLKFKLNEFNVLEIDGHGSFDPVGIYSSSNGCFDFEEASVVNPDKSMSLLGDLKLHEGILLNGDQTEKLLEATRTMLLGSSCAKDPLRNVSPTVVTISEGEEDVNDSHEILITKETKSVNHLHIHKESTDSNSTLSDSSISNAEGTSCIRDDDLTIEDSVSESSTAQITPSLSLPCNATSGAAQERLALSDRLDTTNCQGAALKTAGTSYKGEAAVDQQDEVEERVCVCSVCGRYGLQREFMSGGQYCSSNCFRHAQQKIHFQDVTRMVGSGNDCKEDKENQYNGARQDSHSGDGDFTCLKEVFRPRSQWQDDRQQFSWVRYIEHCQKLTGHGKAAPLKLWSEPFPCSKNMFQPGMKLEGVDPLHQSMFCVLTVADVMGHRVKLHFDGYSDVHDFWTNADSPLLFAAGWCERNGRVLSAPPGTIRFTWKAYFEHCHAEPAPKHAFSTRNMSVTTVSHNIRPSMKLEAEDRKNGWMCVASVKDVMDRRLLIHFDGWDPAFDFWTELNSPYIRPIGWCSENGVHLYPPKDYLNPESFNWHEYLQETNTVAAPARSFKTRPPREFMKHMKLEVVDKRNPMLVRVATVVNVNNYQIEIHFDGWDDMYDYWIDDDCVDAHPPSWCSKTGHPLQPPLTDNDGLRDKNAKNGCPVRGCKGYGHIKGPIYTTHHTAFGCPYSLPNCNKDPESVIPDRVASEPERKQRKFSNKAVLLDLGSGSMDDEDSLKKRVRKRRRFFDEISDPDIKAKLPKLSGEDGCKLLTESMDGVLEGVGVKVETSEYDELALDVQGHQSVFNINNNNSNGLGTHPMPSRAHYWRYLRHLFLPLGDVDKQKVQEWTPEEVEEALVRLPGCADMTRRFVSERVDGDALLMITQEDLISLLHLKLGHALKVMAFVNSIRAS